MIRIIMGGAVGFAMLLSRLLIALAQTSTPLPPSRLALINSAALAGFLIMAHGLKYPRD